jgi:hypothetical protein
MISGRRESVVRHINNPRIHAGQALAVPYIEFISRSKNGTPVASSAYVYRSRIKTNGSPLVEETFYDKLAKRIEEINLEKLAKGLLILEAGGYIKSSYHRDFRLVHRNIGQSK